MTLNGWLQIAIMLALVVLTAHPLGLYLAAVMDGRRCFLTPALAPVEGRIYTLAGVDQASLLAFNAAGFVLLYAILRLQGFLPLTPQGFGALSEHLAFNTAVSFVTNTNWQSYGGETTLSYFSQPPDAWRISRNRHIASGASTRIAFAVYEGEGFLG